MPGSLNTPVAALIGNMIGFLLLVVLVNVPAVWLKLEFDSRPEPGIWLQPPGWVVVAAWWILCPAMGAARWLVVSSPRPGTAAVGWMIVGLGVLCASYAYYTLGLERLTGISSAVFGLAGNGAVIVAALLMARAARAHSMTAGMLVCAVAAWTAFASIGVAQIVFPGAASPLRRLALPLPRRHLPWRNRQRSAPGGGDARHRVRARHRRRRPPRRPDRQRLRGALSGLAVVQRHAGPRWALHIDEPGCGTWLRPLKGSEFSPPEV